jgi:hypothetical protein
MEVKCDYLKQWNERLNMWRESGLTIKEWCRSNKVSYSTFWYWRKKMDIINNAPSPQECWTMPKAAIIPDLDENRLEIISQGVTIRLPLNSDMTTLKRCILALAQVKN